MGWLGYGKYDGDETASVQMSIIEAVQKKNFKLKDGTILNESWEWDVRNRLDEDLVKKVYDNWEKIEKKVMGKLTIKKDKILWNESVAINYMMAADFFMNQKSELPAGLKEVAVEAVDFLIDGGHADDFDSPSSRKKVLRNFIKKLEEYSYTPVQNNKKKKM